VRNGFPLRTTRQATYSLARILHPALVLLAAFLALAVSARPARADDWPQFRGPARDGKSAEKGLLQRWPEGGPRLLWGVTGIGLGYTHPVVAAGVVYVTGMIDRQAVLRAYTPQGQLKWQAPFGPEWYASHPGTRSIPTVHEGLVYVTTGVGRVACLDAATGRVVWSVNVFERYQAPQVKWGWAESVLIDGQNVLCTPCGEKGALVALDRKTGKHVWASPALGQLSSFCSPLLVVHRGRRMIVTMTDTAVVAFDPTDGKPLWQHPYSNARGNHPVTPIYHEGLLYVTSGYGKGAVGLALADDGLSVREVWQQPRQDPVHGQAVLVDGYAYAASHQAAKGLWSCVELKTGRLVWEDKGIGRSGSVIYADGMIYGYSEDGTVGLLRPTPQSCQVVSAFKVEQGDGPHWAHPTVADGRLYIRHGDAMMGYDVKAK